MNSQSIKIVFGIWAVLLVVNIYVLFVGKNVRVKKALLPISVVSAGALSVLFFVLGNFSRRLLYFAIPFAILAIVINLRQLKVCGSCANLVQGEFSQVPKECDKCGARLDLR